VLGYVEASVGSQASEDSLLIILVYSGQFEMGLKSRMTSSKES
jgi:hypothetical protein